MKKSTFILLFALLISVLSTPSWAKKVIAEGYGRNQEEALIDAKKKAIAMTTGEYISSSTKIANNEVFTNYISVINGVVSNYNVIEPYRNSSSPIKIEAEVEGEVLKIALGKDIKTELNEKVLDDLVKMENAKNAAIDELFQDESEIYRFSVGAVKVRTEKKLKSTEVDSYGKRVDEFADAFCYEVTFMVETSKLWRAKYMALQNIAEKQLEKRFGKYKLPLVNSLDFYDETTDTWLDAAPSVMVSDPFNRSSKIILVGSQVSKEQTNSFCTFNKITKFGQFKFKFKNKKPVAF